MSKLPIPVPPTPVPPLKGSPQLRLPIYIYELAVYNDPIFPLPPPNLPDRPNSLLPPVYHLSGIEEEPVDANDIEHDLNTEFEENAPIQKGIIHEV